MMQIYSSITRYIEKVRFDIIHCCCFHILLYICDEFTSFKTFSNESKIGIHFTRKIKYWKVFAQKSTCAPINLLKPAMDMNKLILIPLIYHLPKDFILKLQCLKCYSTYRFLLHYSLQHLSQDQGLSFLLQLL